jgi:hypothetical protein
MGDTIHDYEVRRVVVRSIPVDMVDALTTGERPAIRLHPCQAVLVDITRTVREWMLRSVEHHVSGSIDFAPALPPVRTATSHVVTPDVLHGLALEVAEGRTVLFRDRGSVFASARAQPVHKES